MRIVLVTTKQRELLGGLVDADGDPQTQLVLTSLLTAWDAAAQGLFLRCFLRRTGCTLAETATAPGASSCQHCIDAWPKELAAKKEGGS